MKVAILLSGHIRTWESCKSNFLIHFNKFGDVPDVFIHTYRQKVNSYNGDDGKQTDLNDDEVKDLFKELNVKKIVIENDNVHMDEFMKNYSIYSNGILLPVYGQGMKLMLCNKLRKEYEQENNFKYDVIVRTRFDILINSELDYSLALKNPSTIYNCYGGTYGFPNDMFAFGARDVMDIYCDRLQYSIKLLIETRNNDKFCSHTSLKYISETPVSQLERGRVKRDTSSSTNFSDEFNIVLDPIVNINIVRCNGSIR